MVNCSQETPIQVQPSLSANTKCWSLSVKMARIIDSHKKNRHFIEKSIGRATWLLENKTLICGLMFSTIDIYFIDSEWGLENIYFQKKSKKKKINTTRLQSSFKANFTLYSYNSAATLWSNRRKPWHKEIHWISRCVHLFHTLFFYILEFLFAENKHY